MKPAVIAAVVLAATIYLNPRSEGQQRPSGIEQGAQSKAQSGGQASASQNNSQRPQTKTEATKNQPPKWYESPEWVLVIVGIVTCFVIGWQSWETRRAAEATRINAEVFWASQQP